MDVGQTRGTPRDWENTLEKVRGILSARVTVKDDQILAVQVLARAGRHPKQIMRDAVSVLLTKHGVELEPRLVRVAQVESSEEFTAGPSRVRIAALDYRSRGNWGDVAMTIEYGGVMFSGSAQGSSSGTRRLHLVAQANLNALSGCLQREDVFFAIEDIALIKLAGEPIVVVGVGVLGPNGEELLTGSSLIRGDEREAVARATLDAVNRRFALLVARDEKPHETELDRR